MKHAHCGQGLQNSEPHNADFQITKHLLWLYRTVGQKHICSFSQLAWKRQGNVWPL